MTDSPFPLKHTVTVQAPNEQTVDRFGNTHYRPGQSFPLRVAGWAVNKVDEVRGEHILRTIDQLTLYADYTIEFQPGTQVTLPNGTRWRTVGSAEDYGNGPWWDPGLQVIHATRVEG